MKDKLEIYLSHKVAQTKNNVGDCENYFAEKYTFHGGWEQGYYEGRLSILEDILDMLEDEKEAFEKERIYDVGDVISHKVTHWMKKPSPPEV